MDMNIVKFTRWFNKRADYIDETTLDCFNENMTAEMKAASAKFLEGNVELDKNEDFLVKLTYSVHVYSNRHSRVEASEHSLIHEMVKEQNLGRSFANYYFIMKFLLDLHANVEKCTVDLEKCKDDHASRDYQNKDTALTLARQQVRLAIMWFFYRDSGLDEFVDFLDEVIEFIERTVSDDRKENDVGIINIVKNIISKYREESIYSNKDVQSAENSALAIDDQYKEYFHLTSDIDSDEDLSLISDYSDDEYDTCTRDVQSEEFSHVSLDIEDEECVHSASNEWNEECTSQIIDNKDEKTNKESDSYCTDKTCSYHWPTIGQSNTHKNLTPTCIKKQCIPSESPNMNEH